MGTRLSPSEAATALQMLGPTSQPGPKQNGGAADVTRRGLLRRYGADGMHATPPGLSR